MQGLVFFRADGVAERVAEDGVPRFDGAGRWGGVGFGGFGHGDG